jgi:signal transduction histidine kinase
MTWRWSPAGGLLLAGTACVAVAVALVWRRRANAAAASLLVVLAAMQWSVAYALELSAGDPASRQFWGDLKYVGICLLPPAWLALVARYTGRTGWSNPAVGALLAIEPLAVLVLLANNATHDLIRFEPAAAPGSGEAVVEAGPLFWPHLIYTDAVIWTGTAVLLLTLGRMSRLYRRQSAILFGAVFLPVVVNLLFNLDLGPFGRVDLTPFAFLTTAAVLVWAVLRFNLLDLRPVARSRSFQTIGDPVLVLDPFGRVIDANPAAERLVGQPIAAVAGQPLDRLLPGGALAAPPADQATTAEVVLGDRTYDLVSSPLPGRRRPSGQLLVARDVTERRLAEERLCAALNRERLAAARLTVALERERAASEHLRSLDERKSAFLQAVSHDLRTPLASVLGIALTLQRSRQLLEAGDVSDLLDRLIGNARKLDRILAGLLDLDRLGRGMVDLNRERVDLAELVATVVKEARQDLLDTHPVHVELLPVQIAADPAKVERVVENLLANAARHTQPGTPVWVRVEQHRRGALLTVADAGPGVPAEQREAIFQPFQRGREVANHAPGTGVGLALVAQLVGLHGGRAWVEERAGGGASFRVLLPDAPDAH